MNYIFISLITIGLCLSGCRSTYNTTTEYNDPNLIINADRDGSLSIAIRTNTLKDNEQGFINTKLSYIESYKNEKYFLIQEVNEWSRKHYANASYWTPSDRFWISKNGVEKLKITPGKWTAYIFHTTGDKNILYKSNITISTLLIPPGTRLY